MYSLHIETWTWKEHTPDVSGDAPPPLFGATAAVLLDGRNLLLFGGTGGEGGAPPSSVITVLDTCRVAVLYSYYSGELSTQGSIFHY